MRETCRAYGFTAGFGPAPGELGELVSTPCVEVFHPCVEVFQPNCFYPLSGDFLSKLCQPPAAKFLGQTQMRIEKWCQRCNKWDEHYPKAYACVPCMKANANKWRQENRERAAQLKLGWHLVNIDHVRAIDKAYRNRPDRRIAQRIHNLTRIARFKAAPGRFTPSDIRALMVAQRGLCAICRCSILMLYHIDHKLPLSRGGSNWPYNLQLLCPPCNVRKSNNLPVLPRRVQV